MLVSTATYVGKRVFILAEGVDGLSWMFFVVINSPLQASFVP